MKGQDQDTVGSPALVVYHEDEQTWTVSSSPIRLVRVSLFRRGALYFYQDISVPLSAARLVPLERVIKNAKQETAYFDLALKTASDYVTRMARHRWKEDFTPAQRYCMGQQRCPANMGAVRCNRPNAMGTVWCEWHPMGKAIAR